MSPYAAMPANRRPNVLFFFTDDQRFDTIHALGNEQAITPTMDTLVRGGTAFTRAHIMGGSHPAVCMPSRAMVNTGRTLFHLERQGQGIPCEHVLLAEALRQAGYTTYGTGKWHNGPASYARSFARGAEIFYGGMEDHWNVPVCRFDLTGRYDCETPIVRDPFHSHEVTHRRCDHITPGKHSSELFCDAAIQFLQSYDSPNPFFMYIAFMAPHDPRTMPREYLEMFDPDEMAVPPNSLPEHPFDNGELKVRDELLAPWPRTPEVIRRNLADYYAMITHADAQMAGVMEVLKARGFADNTIVVFAGDNGIALGQHGLLGKQSLYDHSVRVPLIMAGPGIPKDQRCDAYCYLLDVFPTLCELTGIPVPATVEGKSLVRAMHDPADKVRDTLLCAYKDVQRSVRDRRFKLIEYVVKGKRTTQLFDMQADPWEMNSLADDPAYAGDVARLRRDLVRWRDELDDTQPGLGETFWRGYEAGG